MSLSEEVIKNAIDSVKKIQDAIDKIAQRKGLDQKRKEEFGSAFRGRTREFPEFVESLGLLPSLTFAYAKAGKLAYRGVCSLIDTGNIDKEALNELDKTKFGYGSYLHEVLYYIERNVMKDIDHTNPIASFEKMYGKTHIIKQLLMSYLLEVKKLAEALFKPER